LSEWLILLPWKGSVPHGTVDSNSTLSTINCMDLALFYATFILRCCRSSGCSASSVGRNPFLSTKVTFYQKS